MDLDRSESPPVLSGGSLDASPTELLDAHAQSQSDVRSLAADHDLFAELFDRNGVPPLWRREATFGTLVRFILEQHVSLASAQAVYGRLERRIGSVTPDGVLSSTDEQMKSDGFSRQKTSYVRGIADLILSGDLDLVAIAQDPDHGNERLLEVRGIGPWTAACFRLFVSGERDVWPTGDRALYVSIARNLRLTDVPDRDAGDTIASGWAPYRATAAKMLWHDYLGGRSHEPNESAGFVKGTGKVPR